MIIIAGKTIQEVREQLATVEALAAAGYRCGVGGQSLAEVKRGLETLTPNGYVGFTNPNLEPLEEECCCCECNRCECEEEADPQDPNYEYLLDRICQMLRD